MNNIIKETAFRLGAEICGIASVERFADAPEGFHPVDILPGAKSVVVIGKQFSRGVFDAKTNAPYTLVRNKLVEMIDSIAVSLTFEIEKHGYKAVPIPSAEPYEFWDAEERHGRGILSLKHAAQLAGIGSIGKNTLLVNDKYGNRLWLGAIVTDAVLESDPLAEKMCPSSCSICIDSCPQGALDTISINQKKCRERCGSYTDGGGFIYSCNICRKVCPFCGV